jgi:hypothetical protein
LERKRKRNREAMMREMRLWRRATKELKREEDSTANKYNRIENDPKEEDRKRPETGKMD